MRQLLEQQIRDRVRENATALASDMAKLAERWISLVPAARAYHGSPMGDLIAAEWLPVRNQLVVIRKVVDDLIAAIDGT